MQLFSITFALHCPRGRGEQQKRGTAPHLHFCCPLLSSHPHYRCLSSPIPLCKLLRRTRTIIIKTKMFKIHFLSLLLHPPLNSHSARCHLSCASSSSSYIACPRPLPPAAFCPTAHSNVSQTAVSLPRAHRPEASQEETQRKRSCLERNSGTKTLHQGQKKRQGF